MSLGGPRHGARDWCLGRVPKHRNQWQELEGLLFSPQNSQLGHILSFCYNGSFLRVCRILRFVKKKLDFAFLSLGGPSHGARVWCLGRVPKHRNQWQEVEGLLFSPQKLSVGAYFELLFIGSAFLIHLSNRSDSPRFRAPWKKIRQEYGTQQEPSLFKGHPFSYQYGEALCLMVHS